MSEAGLWRNHEATPGQRKRFGRATQADVLLALLREARSKGLAVELPTIMAAGIAQHGARFNEIRSRGFVIENELDRDIRGVVRSRYRLKYDPERDGADAR